MPVNMNLVPEVGSAAMKWIPTGGVFVTGGVTPKVARHVEAKDAMFMQAYHDEGRAGTILKTIPLFGVAVDGLGMRYAWMRMPSWNVCQRMTVLCLKISFYKKLHACWSLT
jgi:glucokinase